ncbi:MAG: MFS transporter [Caldilineaceae bacterium]|nr:MFS transporter [Caldilineaceae bacterium]
MSNLLLLTGIIGLVYLSIGFSSPLITLYLKDLGASYQQIALILTSFSATALLSNYAWGWVTDRIGRRKPILLAGLLGLGVAYWQLSRVPDANIAWGIRVLEGMAAAAYATPSLALMGDLLADTGQRGRRMGYYRGSASMMFAVGAFFGGSIADRVSISLVLSLCAGVYLLAAFCTLFVREVAPVKKTATPEVVAIPAPPPAKERQLPLLFLLGAMLWTAAHGAGASMWPNYMDSLGYAKTEITRLWGLAALVEFPSMAVAGIASDAIGRAPLLFAGGAFAAIVHIGYVTLAAVVPALLIIQVIRGFAFGSFTTTGMTFAAEWGSQQRRGRNSGVYNAANGAGGLIGTFLGGTIVQLLGFGSLYTVCALLAAGSAIAFLLLRRQQKAASEEKLPVGAD